jgi:hypothetical protein
MIEIYHTLLKQLIRSLNMCGVGKIGLGEYDLDQGVV